MTGTRKITDPALVLLALLATFVGLFFIFDAGYARSLGSEHGFMPNEFKTQLICVPIALALGFLCASFKPQTCKKLSAWIFAGCLMLVLLVPKFGHGLNGAQRWIGIGALSIQPAELMKFATVLFLAGVFCWRKPWPKKMKPQKDWGHWMDHVAVPKIARAVPAMLVLVAIFMIDKEPDLGTASVIAVIAFAMFFFGGVSRKSLAVMVVLATLACCYTIKQQPYRWDRIRNHTERWQAKNVDDSSYQTVQSELAMATGGFSGLGVGNGRAKQVIPEPTTDFIFATIGEEFGLGGALLVLACMAALTWRLVQQAARAPSRFGSLVLYGMATWIGIQASVNVMMANGFLPAIGIPLPFVSYGGSSLVALWCGIGLCQSVLSGPLPEPAKAKVATPQPSPAPSRRRATLAT